MNTEKMTVHRALAELKTLDDRIEKAIKNATYCIANKHSNTKVKGVEINQFIENMKSDYKSIKTLINRRNAMKKAVVLSNAITEVEIDGVKYRVAEAIEMKNSGMDNYTELLNHICSMKASATCTIDKNNGETLVKKADDYIAGLFGSKDKTDSKEIESIRQAYIDANTYDFVDPLKVNEIISELTDKIQKFNADIDACLSVSNALTEIEFEYETF